MHVTRQLPSQVIGSGGRSGRLVNSGLRDRQKCLLATHLRATLLANNLQALYASWQFAAQICGHCEMQSSGLFA
uniref:Transposase n=1 Tax=Loa loa TaxID=7209 RepID=A0A1I7VLC0_LOALO